MGVINVSSFKELEPYLSDNRVNAYLNMLMDAEGTSQYGNPYAVAGGGKVTIKDLSQAGGFPSWGFKQTDGKSNTSSAAGAFQFLNSTYDGLRKQGYEVNDFQPRTQRLAAIALLKQNGALPYILNGDFSTAIKKSAGTWASLPGSPYAQKTRDVNFVQRSLQKHLNDPNISLNLYDQYATAQPLTATQQMANNAEQQKVENPYASLYNQTETAQVNPDDNYANQQIASTVDWGRGTYSGFVDPDVGKLVGDQYKLLQNNLWGIQ